METRFIQSFRALFVLVHRYPTCIAHITLFVSSALKVCNSAVIAPVARLAPSQWVVLWSPHFSSRRIDIAFELRLCASSHIWVQLFAISIRSNSGALLQHCEHIGRGWRARRLGDVAILVGDRVLGWRRGIGGGGARSWSAESAGGLFLKFLKDLLLLFWETRWRGLGCPC
jgi:hypothetical protein